MCKEKTPWEKAADFHGHECPGLALGYKAAEAAIKVFGQVRDVNEEIVAVVENDSCAVDAIQSVLGCTVGKGNLIFRNNGKHVYTIGNRKDGKAVRISLKYGVMDRNGSKDERMASILQSDTSELFDVTDSVLKLPEKAVIFKTVRCASCGEGVMEAKARIKNGEIVCPDCFENYTRGW